MSSAAENAGNLLSKLFQVILVFLLAASLIIFFISKGSEDPNSEEKGKGEAGRRLSDEEARRLVAKLRELYGVEESVPNRSAPGIKSEGGSGIIPVRPEQEKSKGDIPLDRLFELAKEMERDVDYLADRTTKVEQAMAWIHADQRLHYVILLRPYDPHAARMMKGRGEDLFVSFLSGDGKRLIPSSAPEQVPTKKLRIAAMEGKASGWTFYGELPLEGKDGNEVENPKVGWIFSNGLHARLKRLQQPQRDENAPVTDPFGLDIEVKPGKKPPVDNLELSAR